LCTLWEEFNYAPLDTDSVISDAVNMTCKNNDDLLTERYLKALALFCKYDQNKAEY